MSSELIKFFENQIRLENKIVDSVSDAIGNIDNPVVSTTLKGVSLDSQKHAMMYNSVISLLGKNSTALNEEQLELQKKVIDDHIKMEEAVIKDLKRMLPTIENEKVDLLLSAILKDEERHHRLLKTLYAIIVRGETITEEDWWDNIWGDVPGLWI